MTDTNKSDPTDDEIRKEWNRTQDPIATVRAVLAARNNSEQAAELPDALDDFDHQLSQWAQAYPLSAFPEPDLKRAHEVLTAAGMTLDSISASNMRHVVTKLNAEFDAVRAARRTPPAPPAAGVPSALAKALQRGYEGSSFVTSETPTLRLYYSTNEEAEAAHDALMDAIDALATSGAPAEGQPSLDTIPTSWELSFGSDDEEAQPNWRVHCRHGSVNDREWTLIGTGSTPSAAIAAARRASGAGTKGDA